MTQADRARHKRFREIVNSSQGYERRVASQMIEKINITSDGHWLWSGTVQQPSGLPALNLWNTNPGA